MSSQIVYKQQILRDHSLRSFVDERLDQAIVSARHALLLVVSTQKDTGASIWRRTVRSAEYIMMMHFMDEIDVELEAKLAVYLRSHQGDDGGWPLFHGGKSDLSCSVQTYYALKLAGDSPDATQ